ncbi:MAG: YihY/virulence factor BrkB family protein [Pseudomonadota bacterium]|nr:YihY/virulence factor BrkB family protein [Pseudomonadota bacterium]
MKSKINLGEFWALIKGAGSAWVDDYAPSMGAALSYYTVFSLAPMLLIVIGVAGLVFGQDAARGALMQQLSGMMGANAAKAIQDILASASKPSEGAVATVVGVVVLLIGATTVFGELQDALDRIWRVPAKDKPSGIWGLLRSRLLSFGMILGIAFLLMVSLVASTAVSALGKWWSPFFGGWEVLAQGVTFLFGLVVTAVGFALIYKFMPRARVRWHDVWIGAVVTSVLFSLGRFLIGLYIGKSGVASAFGAAGSLIVVFVWVYYSAQIFLLGAEFTWVYATKFGSRKEAELEQERAAPSRSGANGKQVPSTEQACAAHVGSVDAALSTPGVPTAPVSSNLRPFAPWLVAGMGMGYLVKRLLRR